MKKLCLLAFSAFLTICLQAQLKTTKVCPDLYVDILDGKVNGLYSNSTIGEIKGKLPCFSSTVDDTATSKCGGNVFYKDKDIYFYTGRDYVEIREKFKGKLSLPLLGAARTGLFKMLGLPKIKDVKWDAFQTQYGTLILYYNAAGKVNKIQFSINQPTLFNSANNWFPLFRVIHQGSASGRQRNFYSLAANGFFVLTIFLFNHKKYML